MELLAQAEAEAATLAAEVVKQLAEHKSVNGSGLDSFMFLLALLSLFVGSFYALKWIMTHNQECVREITTDHKQACETLTETFRSETAAIRVEHNKDRDAFRDGLHVVRNFSQHKPREGSG